jgi:hypothetical protein
MTNRPGIQPADDLGVVLDHVIDAFPGDPVGLAPGFLDRVRGTRPAWRQRRVSRLLEQL